MNKKEYSLSPFSAWLVLNYKKKKNQEAMMKLLLEG